MEQMASSDGSSDANDLGLEEISMTASNTLLSLEVDKSTADWLPMERWSSLKSRVGSEIRAESDQNSSWPISCHQGRDVISVGMRRCPIDTDESCSAQS